MQLPYYIFKKCNYFGMATVRGFVIIISIPYEELQMYVPKRPSGAPLYTLSKLYDAPVGFVAPLPHLR